MAVRHIVKIDQEKCTGCGQCANACAEGAIQIVNDKAKLISESYCDGLGACIGHCPAGAITIEERAAAEFDEQATKAHLAAERPSSTDGFVCPGLMARQLGQSATIAEGGDHGEGTPSRLTHWPIQLKLVAPTARCFADADLLVVADCVPFAVGDFHDRFLKGHSIVVGCPKLDDPPFYIEKLAAILRANRLQSLTVVHMEVPCCSGLTRIAQQAILRSGVPIRFDDVAISLRGRVVSTQTMATDIANYDGR